jgi:gliding motility-associated-like protein
MEMGFQITWTLTAGDGINDGTKEGVDDTMTEDCDDDGLSNYLDPDACFNGLEIPQGFSPNGDLKNDLFEIVGLDEYPANSLTIFNRWGNKVFEAQPYRNNWDGRNHFGVSYGDGALPIGTYFYVFDPGDGSKVLTGYVYLNR